ncbi:MAG: glycosyltransferase family 4 protein [Cytophagales bacterium]
METVSQNLLKIGFHYHIPIFEDENGKFFTPSYFGVFLDSLAANCSKLYLFLYLARPEEIKQCNYQLKNDNVIWVNLGSHNSVPKRLLRISGTSKIVKSKINDLDAFIIRTPTPLILFAKNLISFNKLFLYVVGDYDVGDTLKVSHFKKPFILFLFKLMERKELKLGKHATIITNSQKLLQKFRGKCRDIHLIKSTSVSEKDLYLDQNKCISKNEINILYSGRLDPIKNLPIVIKVVKSLITEHNLKCNFHLVYIEDEFSVNYIKSLRRLADDLQISAHLIDHGQKMVGEELNQLYRNSDILIIPSLSEGFPRAIWDAMANSTAVIATNVGSIPHFLSHGKDALIINPNSEKEIVDSILELKNNQDLYRSLIVNAYALAKENTLEKQGRLMIETISANLNE